MTKHLSNVVYETTLPQLRCNIVIILCLSWVSTGSKKNQKHKTNHKIGNRWTDECEHAFTTIKDKLTSAPLLGFTDYNMPFCFEVDASLEGFGAILSQIQDGHEVVIAYDSRILIKHEKFMRSCSSMKLEFLGLHWAVTKKFRE